MIGTVQWTADHYIAYYYIYYIIKGRNCINTYKQMHQREGCPIFSNRYIYHENVDKDEGGFLQQTQTKHWSAEHGTS